MSKTLKFLFFLIVSAQAGFAQPQTKPAAAGKPPVTVYYFHPTERCPIDQSIEENTRKLMQSDFAKNIKDGTVKMLILNTDDKANAKTVARFSMNAQALYLVKTEKGREVKIDLTEFAFSYGLSNPAKFRSRLKDEIISALK
ncbi:MAG: nitrophenyl compound nitroreductase subunit ArsF family protein [Bacteroidota bacterium]